MDIIQSLETLSSTRPIFHIEADLQFALAWEIQNQYPKSSIRFEYKPPEFSERIYLDLRVTSENGTVYLIELKYKTRSLNVSVLDEKFDLLDQGAQDLGRYDFLKDIQRLENVVSNHNNSKGFAIFLTNDSSYWKIPSNSQTIDAKFRIHDGGKLHGELKWGLGASQGTTKGRNEPILIKGDYDLIWRDYSIVNKSTYGKFRYLVVEV